MRVDLGSAQAATPWEQAHALLTPGQPFAAAGVTGVEAIEPDLDQPWLPPPSQMAASQQAFCTFDDQDGSVHSEVYLSAGLWISGSARPQQPRRGSCSGTATSDEADDRHDECDDEDDLRDPGGAGGEAPEAEDRGN